jgi:hypothetical protein
MGLFALPLAALPSFGIPLKKILYDFIKLSFNDLCKYTPPTPLF